MEIMRVKIQLNVRNMSILSLYYSVVIIFIVITYILYLKYIPRLNTGTVYNVFKDSIVIHIYVTSSFNVKSFVQRRFIAANKHV